MEFVEIDIWLAERVIGNGNWNDFMFWEKRIKERLDFLNPLINELELKGIKLSDLCNELNNEYNKLVFLNNTYRNVRLSNNDKP